MSIDSSPCSSHPQALTVFQCCLGETALTKGPQGELKSLPWVMLNEDDVSKKLSQAVARWFCFREGLDISHIATQTISLLHLKKSHRLPLSWLERWSSYQRKQPGNLAQINQLWQNSGISNLSFDMAVWHTALRQAKYSNCNIKHKKVVYDVQLLPFFFLYYTKSNCESLSITVVVKLSWDQRKYHPPQVIQWILPSPSSISEHRAKVSIHYRKKGVLSYA